MSFGFSVGDFVTVAELAWVREYYSTPVESVIDRRDQRLYRDCYQVARGAPQEFQLLVREMTDLTSSLSLLKEEVQDHESPIRQGGEARMRMMKEMVTGLEITLNSLEDVARKYDILSSSCSKRKRFKARILWSFDFSSIEKLRNKLVYHNGVINLLLTSLGNSSLRRIQSSTAALTVDVKEIRDYISSYNGKKKAAAPGLSLTFIDDELSKISLSAALMKQAEVSQPWSTIGLDQWVEAGRWWMSRSRMELFAILQPKQTVTTTGYLNLIKASWILVDIISCHPQVPFMTASAGAEIELLSASIRKEFARLSALESIIPALVSLKSEDLCIWETVSMGNLLKVYKDSQNFDRTVDNNELVMLKKYATCVLSSHTVPLPAIVHFLVSEDATAAKLVAQNQSGVLIMFINWDEKPVKASYDDTCIRVNDQEIIFPDHEDVHFLFCLIEATNFYLYNGMYRNDQKNTNHGLDDLKAVFVLFAIKCQRKSAVTRLLNRFLHRGSLASYCKEDRLTYMALDLASQYIDHLSIDDQGYIISEPPIAIEAFCSSSKSLLLMLIEGMTLVRIDDLVIIAVNQLCRAHILAARQSFTCGFREILKYLIHNKFITVEQGK